MFLFCRVSTVEAESLFEMFRLQTEDTEKSILREASQSGVYDAIRFPFARKSSSFVAFPPMVEMNVNDMVVCLTKNVGKEKWLAIGR